MRRGPRATPGRFRTRVITEGVTPSLHVDYKHTRIKQYHKEGRALRTETTINDTTDFGIGKRLTNLPALREIGTHANRRLLRVQSLSHDPITGADALHTVTAPITTDTGTRIPGLQLGQQRSHALLAALPRSGCQPDGFANRICARSPPSYADSTRPRSPPDRSPTTCAGCASRGLITRIPHTHRYSRHRPRPAHRRCSSPPSTTDSYPPAWPSSPTSSPRHHYARPPTPTTMPSITLPAQQVSPSNTNHPTQHVKLDSEFRLRRI